MYLRDFLFHFGDKYGLHLAFYVMTTTASKMSYLEIWYLHGDVKSDVFCFILWEKVFRCFIYTKNVHFL